MEGFFRLREWGLFGMNKEERVLDGREIGRDRINFISFLVVCGYELS